MGLVVQKYGGTSVGNVARIREVAKKVVEARRAGDSVVVVVSAMAGETDRLIRLAHEVTERPNAREMDMLVSTGEQVSIALLAMAIQSLGEAAESFTGEQVGILTDSAYTKARIKKISADRLRAALKEGKIAVVAGFQGVDEHRNVTTLG